ncbi:MAG: hypothetical protein R3A51_03715 [Nannocystaceae bacterium]|nr:hypothetical protein [Myxococcales bacterium]
MNVSSGQRDLEAEGPPSTRFLILAVSLTLILCGLVVTGVIPVAGWLER